MQWVAIRDYLCYLARIVSFVKRSLSGDNAAQRAALTDHTTVWHNACLLDVRMRCLTA